MKKVLLLKIALFFLVFTGIVTESFAQITTSSMSGEIKDAKGGLSGASVKVTHIPTGTVYHVTANSAGYYSLGGMRVGGPYTVEVSYTGFQTKKIEDVYLKLGEDYLFDVALSESTSALNEVVIVKKDPIVKRNGASTIISRTKLENLPTIERNINDLTRLTPQANGSAIGGGNYRSNNFTVDGANFNNQFGIGQNIPAGGSPISIDALEEISVNVTPFDVRQTGFIGAAINAITRSGKNTFFGNVMYTLRSDNQQGVKVEDRVITNIQKLDVKQYGFSFGGPIIKNKLFFFVNAERMKQVEPGPSKVASADEVENNNLNIARPSVNFMNTVRNYLAKTYGYETGPYQGYSYNSNNDKLFARLDWNISTKHKFSIRYSMVENKKPFGVSGSTSGAGFTPSDGRTSIYSMSFKNSGYYQNANLYTGSAELNSNLGKFNNLLRLSFVHQYEPRSTDGKEFPLVDILDGGTAKPRSKSTYVSFGYEPFSFGNLRDVRNYTASNDLTFTLGKHNFMVGAQAELSKVKNGFQRYGTGYYVYKSWDDFVNNNRPLNFAITYPLTAGGSQAFASFKFFQLSAYGQDEISVSDKLKITLGLRLELPTYPDVSEIKTHPLVAEAKFNNAEKINTGELPKSRVMFSPRAGFNYDIWGDGSLQLRGGTGIFTGRIPFVWIVAQSGDAGMLQYTQTLSGEQTPNFNADYKALYPNNSVKPGSIIPSNVTAMSPNLKFPQQWKNSLGLDAKLPFGFIGKVDLIYGEDLIAVYARNANLVDPKPLNVANYPDNRMIYPADVNRYINKLDKGVISTSGTNGFDVAVVDNARGGNYFSSTFQLTKPFNNKWEITVAYAYSYAKNLGDQNGDQILNLWSIPPQSSGNPNNPSLSYTSNIIPHRIVGSINHKTEWIKGLQTGISLFYQGGSQGRYSYVYNGDFNRDNNQNDLIYVPKDRSEIDFVTNGSFTKEQQEDVFFNLIENDPYLRSRKGKYAERNGAVAPWKNRFDFRVTQEILALKTGKVKNSLEFYFDVHNIGNLINSKWGVNRFYYDKLLTPTNVDKLTPNGDVRPTFRLNTINNQLITSTTGPAVLDYGSTYNMQFGLRYSFN